MPIPSHITLGRRSAALAADVRWDDEYPAWQPFADELEELLIFAEAHQAPNEIWSALKNKPSQRDGALSELRVARFLGQQDFSLKRWKPVGAGTKEGEYVVSAGVHDVFVEVKGPGWEGEFSPEQLVAGRKAQGKNVDGEGRAFNNSWAITKAIENAYPKFSDRQPNLLVIADDLIVSMEYGTDFWAGEALYDQRPKEGATDPCGFFAAAGSDRLGGVMIFWTDAALGSLKVTYHTQLYLNPLVSSLCKLPDEFAVKLNGKTLPPS